MDRRVRTAQQSKYDCGAAALCSLAAWHGLYVSLAKVRMLCGCTKDGITIKGIIEAGTRLGFNCRGFKSAYKDPASLDGIPLPAIAHTVTEEGLYHFITLLERRNGGFVVMDPSGGKLKRLSRGAFSRTWTGYVILAEPSGNFAAKDERGNVYRKLLDISLQYKEELVHTICGAVILALIGICNSIFLQRIIDIAIPQRDTAALASIAAASVALAVLGLFISYKKQIYLSAHGIKITGHLVKGYLEKIVTLGKQFYNQYRDGDITSRVSDVFNIRIFLSEAVVSIIVSVAALGVSIPILFHYNSSLAIMCTAFIPLYIIIYCIAGPKNTRYSRALAQAGAKFEGALLQCIGGNAEIRHHCAEKWALERLESCYDALAGEMFRTSRVSAVLGVSTDGLSKGIITSVLVSGGFAVFNNGITVGELVSFYTLSPLFCVPLANLANMNPVITQARVSAERLFEIMDLECGDDGIAANEYHKDSVNDICITGLSFSYPGSMPLLEDMDMMIRDGKITLIDGPTGAGKSTLASLLARDMDADGGTILYGGRDIYSIPAREWRRIVGIVPQKCHIFNTSILENIVLGDKNPDIGRVSQICTMLGIIEKITSLPSSFLTVAGEMGTALSGGEIQKIAIARVLYQNPEIIIFDEATSAMDAGSEKMVMDLMRQLSDQGRTVIAISHNTRFRELADYVIEIP